MRFDEELRFADATKTCESRKSSLPLPINEEEAIQLMEHGATWINLMVNPLLSEPVFADWQRGYRTFMNQDGKLQIVSSDEEKPFTCIKKGILPKLHFIVK